jgi:PPOX class probable F420-dependent enzyme
MRPLPIPQSHNDLIDGSHCAALSTMMPSGQPQTTPVWFNLEGDYVLINTMRGFQKEKNIRRDPHVSLLIYDPRQPEHYIEIRGMVVEMTQHGALEHLDQLTRLYSHNPNAHFFGDSIPAELETHYTPIKVKIAPTHMRVEG